jgi:hypothetical protein
MLTVPEEDWIEYQQIYLMTLIYCKSVTTKRLCCICNIYTIAVIRNCILRSQSTNTKYIYLIVIVQCHHINKIKNKKYHTEEIYYNVDCSRRGLDRIPTDLPNDTYIL